VVCESVGSVVSANSVVASGWDKGHGGIVSATWGKMLCERKNSNRCDSETQRNNHMSKVGGKKRKKSALLD
jgi:hypothetical protein